MIIGGDGYRLLRYRQNRAIVAYLVCIGLPNHAALLRMETSRISPCVISCVILCQSASLCAQMEEEKWVQVHVHVHVVGSVYTTMDTFLAF